MNVDDVNMQSAPPVAPASSSSSSSSSSSPSSNELRPRKTNKREFQDSKSNEEAKNKMSRVISEINSLNQRLESLMKSIQEVLAQVSPNQSDAEFIYTQYQELQVQLFEKMRELSLAKTEVNLDVDAVSDATRRISGRIDKIEQELKNIQTLLDETNNVRKEFKLGDVMRTEQDLDNYYGVYIYNKMIVDMKKEIRQLASKNFMIGIYSSEDFEKHIINGNIDWIKGVESKLFDDLYNLTKNLPDEAKRREQKSIEAKREALEKAGKLARIYIQNDPTITLLKTSLSVGWRKFKPQKPLSGVADQRMFENDIIEGQEGKVELSVPENKEDKKRMERDVEWRKLPWNDKTSSLIQANAVADLLKIPALPKDAEIPNSFQRMLRGLTKHLGLRIIQYSPTRDPDLGKIDEKIDIYLQIQGACRENQSLDEVQRVIPDNMTQSIINVILGREAPNNTEIGYVLMSEDLRKVFGIVHCRNFSKLDAKEQGITVKTVETTEIGRRQGIPDIEFQDFKNSLEFTFLCSQRNQNVVVRGTNLDYSINGKAPRHLGNLLMIHVFVEQMFSKFPGTVMEIAGNEGNGKAGFSHLPGNTAVAAFYQRYFKFQRTCDLRSFATNANLNFFHPGWEGYTFSPAPKKGSSLPMMFRPYPSPSDIADMISRLTLMMNETYPFEVYENKPIAQKLFELDSKDVEALRNALV